MLRTWPFHEADLLVSLLTREQGVVKGVARHAMRSRRRFGGALEPGTEVVAHYAERSREELVRLDQFETMWSPLRAPMDLTRAAGLQFVVETIEQVLPELAPEDNIYRLAITVLRAMEEHPVWLPVTYFAVWMCRLLGWWPELGYCAVCGLDLRGEMVWWSPSADGVTCADDRRPGSRTLTPQGAAQSAHLGRVSLGALLGEAWPEKQGTALFRDLGAFAVAMLERHIDRRLRSVGPLLSFRQGPA